MLRQLSETVERVSGSNRNSFFTCCGSFLEEGIYWIPVSLVLLAFSLQKGFFCRLLSNKYLVIGGEISYSFYLIHSLMIFAYLQWGAVSGRPLSFYLAVPLVLFATIGMSLLSWYYFEKPANRWVKRILNN